MSKFSRLAQHHLHLVDSDDPDDFLEAAFARASRLSTDPNDRNNFDSNRFQICFNQLLHLKP